MPRIPAPRIPAHVTLRALRESRGYTARMLADKLEDRGVKVDPNHIIAVELGQSGPGTALRAAWADELRINPRDIHTGTELREIIADADAAFSGGKAAA